MRSREDHLDQDVRRKSRALKEVQCALKANLFPSHDGGRAHVAGNRSSLLVIALVMATAAPVSIRSKAGLSPPAQPQSGMGGISSAGNFAPVYDAEKRPITAGGFVDKDHGTVVFEDETKAAGLSHWRHVMGTPEKKYILETDGSGVGLIDFDNDGWLDIYFVNGSTYDALSGKKAPPACSALP